MGFFGFLKGAANNTTSLSGEQKQRIFKDYTERLSAEMLGENGVGDRIAGTVGGGGGPSDAQALILGVARAAEATAIAAVSKKHRIAEDVAREIVQEKLRKNR